MREIFLKEFKKLEKIPLDIKLHFIRERLQYLMLSTMDKRGYFSKIIFMGGTALRILFDVKRFSEDLDFSLDIRHHKTMNFTSIVQSLQKDLLDYGFSTEIKQKTEGAVQSCYFKFTEILHELSPRFRTNQKIFIRVDIDMNPPTGFNVETSAIEKKDFFIKLKHHDKPSLFAGKLNAIFCRNYLKGRDIYDFIWFCANNIPVNLTFLNNGYIQSQKKDPPWTPENFQKFVADKISNLDLKKAFHDASLFMEDKTEERFFDPELLQSMALKIKIV